MQLLADRVAMVTGGGSGIGRAIALAYGRAGARLMVTDISVAAGEETIEILRNEGVEACFVETDVRKPEDAHRSVLFAVQRYGRLDIACNNAGIEGSAEPLASCPDAAWQSVIDVNLSGVFYGMKHQITQMLQNGGGAIVNLASVLSQVAVPRAAAYVAAKHGVVGLTRAGALEYASQNIRVNAVGPGVIDTPILRRLDDEPSRRAQIAAQHPLGRIGQPEEVAELVLWLSSPHASFVTGSYYPVDGGYLIR